MYLSSHYAFTSIRVPDFDVLYAILEGYIFHPTYRLFPSEFERGKMRA